MAENGTSLVYRFNIYKILEQDQPTLEASENPFAMVVLTVLVALQKKRVDEANLLDLKLTLTDETVRTINDCPLLNLNGLVPSNAMGKPTACPSPMVRLLPIMAVAGWQGV